MWGSITFLPWLGHVVVQRDQNEVKVYLPQLQLDKLFNVCGFQVDDIAILSNRPPKAQYEAGVELAIKKVLTLWLYGCHM